MWRATAGKDVKVLSDAEIINSTTTDDWETEAEFVNDISEQESRWGSKTVYNSGHQASVPLDSLRSTVLSDDAVVKAKQLENMPKSSEGYGGKFGVQKDRVDKVPCIILIGIDCPHLIIKQFLVC